jgi:1,3-beta-glucan synthase
LLVSGTYSAVQSRVGNVQTWAEVEQYFSRIVSKNMVALSLVFEKRFFQFQFWNDFIESMYSEHLLSKTERETLKYSKNGKKKPCFRPAPYSKEAQRRIIKFLWSLEAMLNSKNESVPNYRQRYMVRTMPSWTIMVPCFSETCVYLQEELMRPTKGTPRISTIEYISSIYPEEWSNLARELRPDPNGPNPNELLDDFLNTPVLKPDEKLEGEKGQCSSLEVDHICFWASYRGQTLVRTVKGLFNYRIALEKLAIAEEGVWFMKDTVARSRKIKEIQKMVRKKFQIIIAYQIYQPKMWVGCGLKSVTRLSGKC